MATNDMGTTSRGIQYPTNPTQFASADWWKTLAESANTAIGQTVQDASWWKNPLSSATSNLDTVTAPGAYPMLGAQTAAGLGIPVPSITPGWLEVRHGYDERYSQQYFYSTDGTADRVRDSYAGTWRPWRVPGDSWVKHRLSSSEGVNLDTVTAPGAYPMLGARTAAELGIPVPSITPGWLEVRHGYDERYSQQYFYSQDGKSDMRRYSWDSVWRPWVPVGGGAGTGIGAQTLLSPEVDGTWESWPGFIRALNSLASHAEVELLSIGKSVRGLDIPAIRIGDPTKPAFLAIGGQHGNERSNPHGLIVWARQLLEAPTLILQDMCILIVPALNVDNFGLTRHNANDIDLNRDWLAFSQPETVALRDFAAQHDVIAAVDGHSFGYPRQVSLQIALHGTELARARSQELYDAVWKGVEDDGNFVRNYEPLPPDTNLRSGLGRMGIPAILTEIPSRGPNDALRDKPSMGWQLRMVAVTMNAAAHYAWKWTPTYPADLVPAGN